MPECGERPVGLLTRLDSFCRKESGKRNGLYEDSRFSEEGMQAIHRKIACILTTSLFNLNNEKIKMKNFLCKQNLMCYIKILNAQRPSHRLS